MSRGRWGPSTKLDNYHKRKNGHYHQPLALKGRDKVVTLNSSRVLFKYV